MKIKIFDIIEISNGSQGIVLDICKNNYKVRIINSNNSMDKDSIITIKKRNITKVLYHKN